jgi:hypothetical protein
VSNRCPRPLAVLATVVSLIFSCFAQTSEISAVKGELQSAEPTDYHGCLVDRCPFPRTPFPCLLPPASASLRIGVSLTKPNTSFSIRKPASLRSESCSESSRNAVRLASGMMFGLPPE